MAIQTVFVGTTPGDDTGDPARTSFIKINSNFTQAENAASRLVATNAQAITGTAGVLPDAAGVKAYVDQTGLLARAILEPLGFDRAKLSRNMAIEGFDVSGYQSIGLYSAVNATNGVFLRGTVDNAGPRIFASAFSAAGEQTKVECRTTRNTTIDPNGFIKEASPIVCLYKDRAESNGSAELEEMQFERISTGHYRLTGVPELSRDGWYIETPKDRNGNVYFTLDYVESENTLEILTYTPDYSTGRAENGAPVDIIDGRFVSLRFAASPETELPEEA